MILAHRESVKSKAVRATTLRSQTPTAKSYDAGRGGDKSKRKAFGEIICRVTRLEC